MSSELGLQMNALKFGFIIAHILYIISLSAVFAFLELEEVSLDRLTPINALNLLYKIKRIHESGQG